MVWIFFLKRIFLNDYNPLILKKNHIILLATILVSIAIRIPNLNRPLSKHHEFVTVHVLRVMQIWNEGGIARYHFAPVMNYAGTTNKFINNQSMGYSDINGDYYYLSYPPFTFILPYIIFNAFHIPISALSLEWFNIIIHIVSAILLYGIVLRLAQNEKNELIATLATVFFLLNPCSLWFCGNVYFADMLVIFFWMAAMYLLLLLRDEKNFILKIVLFCIALLMGNYTEYLMLMFSAGALVYLFISRYERKKVIGLVILLCVIVPYLLTAYQYSLIGGWPALLHQEVARYKSRSGYNYHNFPLVAITETLIIIKNYIIHYISFIITLVTGTVFLLFERKKLPATNFKTIFWLILIPILLHHLIFLNATMHDFQVLKSGILFSVICSVVICSLSSRWVITFVCVILLINIADYYYVNKPGAFARNGDKYAADYHMAQTIKATANEDEVIFTNIDVSPQLVYYTHRNICRYATPGSAVTFLRQHNLTKGKLFYFDGLNHLQKVESIYP